MSIYNRKHWHALSHSLHFVRHEGDWRPTHPPQRVSRVPDSVCLGLVPGQIDSPYLIIMPRITIPRDEYYTIFSERWESPRGGPWSLPKLPCVPMFPHVFLICSPLNKFAYHLLPPSISSRKNKRHQKQNFNLCDIISSIWAKFTIHQSGMSIRTNLKVARLDFLGLIPSNFEH